MHLKPIAPVCAPYSLSIEQEDDAALSRDGTKQKQESESGAYIVLTHLAAQSKAYMYAIDYYG